MIRSCNNDDFETIYEIVNEAAGAYKGVIPQDRWKDPYMPRVELRREIDEGVIFWGFEEDDRLVGVMGIQNVKDVNLIRHAYVRSSRQNLGIGSKLLLHLLGRSELTTLVGTWADAEWAIRFYERHGFKLVDQATKDRLLKEYWSIPDWQVETSVVLADAKWFRLYGRLE
ncbi:MAG TPA: GNAT family N-acetyltransferase [Terriglobales bacterium]|nr:GNAT family N-acetyltransferase [Terriglobales bacterium]